MNDYNSHQRLDLPIWLNMIVCIQYAATLTYNDTLQNTSLHSVGIIS